nr:hypothetical protein [Kitasatospora aureofaciens]
MIRIGREALRWLLARRGVTFQRTKTWKESTNPEYDGWDAYFEKIVSPPCNSQR